MLLISLYPWMLSPPALHSLHSICSGGVSASGGALGLFRLDVCMCQQGGEFWEKWSNKGETCLIFWKTCWAQGFESASFWESCTSEREKLCLGSVCFVSGTWFFLFSLHFQHDCVERYLCLRGVMFLAFDRLRRAIALVLGDRSLLE